MKRNRKLAMLLITALILAMMVPGSVFAKKKKKYEVPTEGVLYSQDEKGAFQPTDQTFTATYSSDGKVATVTYKDDSEWKDANGEDWGKYHLLTTYSYKWKGNNIRSFSWTHTESSSGPNYSDNTSESYSMNNTIKKKKPAVSKESYVRDYTYKSEEEQGSGHTKQNQTSTYRWNKKEGSVKIAGEFFDDGEKYTRLSANVIGLKKGRRVSDWVNGAKFTYYKDGKLKAVTQNYPDGRIEKASYNKEGYLTNESRVYPPRTTQETTYTWTMNSKTKCPKEVVITFKEKNEAETWGWTNKWVFTKTKKVSKVRNCDAYGYPVWLGTELQVGGLES